MATDTILDEDMGSLLAICIPTYNRADILKESLANNIPFLRKHRIPVYISDNASTDETESVVVSAKSEYDLVRYFKNGSNIGDLNFHHVLGLPTSQYVWAISDYIRLGEKNIESVLSALADAKPDAVIVNGDGRVNEIPNRIYRDADELLGDLGWHTTWLASVVYSRSIVKSGAFPRYYGTHFTQVGGLFEYLANQVEPCVVWLSDMNFLPVTKKKKNSWAKEIFNIFCKEWTEVVLALPAKYRLETKLKCIKMGGRRSGMFGLRMLLRLRQLGLIDYSVVRQHKTHYSYAGWTPYYICVAISVFPRRLLALMFRAYYKLKNSEGFPYF